MKNRIVGILLLAGGILGVSLSWGAANADTCLRLWGGRSFVVPDDSNIIGGRFANGVFGVGGSTCASSDLMQSMVSVAGLGGSFGGDDALGFGSVKSKFLSPLFDPGFHREYVSFGVTQLVSSPPVIVSSITDDWGRLRRDGQGACFVESVDFDEPIDVPEPGTMLLLGTGLVGLVGLMRRKSIGKKTL